MESWKTPIIRKILVGRINQMKMQFNMIDQTAKAHR